MILFVTAYDPSTRPNLSVARLIDGSIVEIFEDNATRETLWSALDQSGNTPLLAMSHGRRRFLRAQGGSPPHAIEMNDANSLQLRRIFAWACLTSAELGQEAAKAGAIWFGFPVKIAAPPDDPRLQLMLARILEIAVSGLEGVHDDVTCRALLDTIVEHAGNALMEIEFLRSTNELPESEYHSGVQQCFEQFQLRLEAWLPGYSEPVRPTRALKQRYDDLDPVRDLPISVRD